MATVRTRGKVGRPRVTDRPRFTERFWAIVPLIESEKISKREAARRLGIGIATLLRLLDDPGQVPRDTLNPRLGR